MQSMYDKVVACITKPPASRTDEEAEILVPWFAKKSQLFESMKSEVIKDIIKNCEFSERPRDNVIIRQGDKGNKFYIILSGKVSIFINTDAVPDDPEDAQEVVVEDINKDGEKKELDRNKYGKYIAPMLAGKSFGELALINKDCVRNASIIADELTHLVEVGRDLYNRSLRSAQEADFRQRIDFVNGSILFQRWMARYKRQAAMSLQKEQMLFDMPIVIQGEPVNGLIFILKGQAKIVIDILQHYVQYPHLNLKEDPLEVDRKEIIGQLMEQNHNHSNNNNNNSAENKNDNKPKLWEKPLRRQGYSAVEQRQAQRHLEIAIVGPGELIGDIEHGMELNTYAQSVICTQNTEFYILDAKNFERLVLHKRNARTMKLLRQKAEIKLLSRVARSLDKQVPLIRHLVHRIEEDHRKEESFIQKRNLPKLQVVRNAADTSSFIPKPGALIDLYGPGTVFYYNRLKRAKKALRIAKQLELSQQKGGGLARKNLNVLEASESETNIIRLIDERDLDDYSPNRAAPLEFHDWETSSQHLEVLEERLRNWYDVTKDLSHSKTVAISRQANRRAPVDRLIKLPRFKKEESNNIHSGTKIYLRPRRPANRMITLDTSNLPNHLNEQEQTSRAIEFDGEKTSEEIFITAPPATLKESSEVDDVSKYEKLPNNTWLPEKITDDYKPQKLTDSSSLVQPFLQRTDDDQELSPTETSSATERERVGEISYLNHLTEINRIGQDSNTRLPYIHIQNRDGSLPEVIHHKTVSRLSNLLPIEAGGDPVGFAVAQSTLENANTIATHGVVECHRKQTLLILKDILDYHLVPIEICSAMKNSELKKESSNLLSHFLSSQQKNDSLPATSPLKSSDEQQALGCQSRFRLRMRSVLLPSRLQGLPVLLSGDNLLKLTNQHNHS